MTDCGFDVPLLIKSVVNMMNNFVFDLRLPVQYVIQIF